MQMEQWENGCVTILLSDQELSGMGVDFGRLDYREPVARQALQAVVSAAREQTGLPPEKHVLVEALPVEAGCLLLITPLPRRRPIRMRRIEKPRVYAVADTDSLLRLAAALSRAIGKLPPLMASSLYRFEEGYRLVVYPSHMPTRIGYLLSEFGECVGTGESVVAFTAEHGCAITMGNALEQLMLAMAPAVG